MNIPERIWVSRSGFTNEKIRDTDIEYVRARPFDDLYEIVTHEMKNGNIEIGVVDKGTGDPVLVDEYVRAPRDEHAKAVKDTLDEHEAYSSDLELALLRKWDILRQELLGAPRWISVDERLPNNNYDVLICLDDGYIYIGSYDGRDGYWTEGDIKAVSVTHWMPLPKSPEEE